MTQNKFTTNNNPTLVAVSSSDGETPVYIYADPISHGVISSSGFSIPNYDYVTLTQATTTDTYVFKIGGASGSTVATITITYTDSGKGTISTVAKT